MKFDPTIQLGDLLTTISILIASIALIANIWRLRTSSNQRRSEFVLNLYRDLWNDDKLIQLFYSIEYHELKIDSNIHRTELEITLDKLLVGLDTFAKIYFMNNLKKSDLDFFKYEFLTVYRYQDIKDYLEYLDNLNEAKQITGIAFLESVWYFKLRYCRYVGLEEL